MLPTPKALNVTWRTGRLTETSTLFNADRIVSHKREKFSNFYHEKKVVYKYEAEDPPRVLFAVLPYQKVIIFSFDSGTYRMATQHLAVQHIIEEEHPIPPALLEKANKAIVLLNNCGKL